MTRLAWLLHLSDAPQDLQEAAWAAATEGWRRADERGDAEGAHRWGRHLNVKGRTGEAVQAWLRADQRGSGAAATDLGLYYTLDYDARHQERDPRRAESAFRRADERGDAPGAAQLGRLLKNQGDVDGAEAAFRRAVNRGDVTATRDLAWMLARREELDEAESIFRLGVRLSRTNDHFDGAVYSLGFFLQQQGDIAGALDVCRGAHSHGFAVGGLTRRLWTRLDAGSEPTS